MELDADQQKVVDAGDGCWAIYAGPGSGKSRCLLHRTARLSGLGKVVALTFTNEAARNLRTHAAKEFPAVDPECFSTLHSLALKFAYDHSDCFPFRLADNPLAVDGLAARAVFDAIGSKINYQAFVSWVSLQKRNRISAIDSVYSAERDMQKLDYALAYKKYQTNLREKGLLDFDDLLFFWADILETRPDVRQQHQYNHVLVDEAQDLSELDWTLIQLLSYKHKNVTAVGDASQAIYSFRGGLSENFLNMKEFFPRTKTLYLGANYRSSKHIVDFVKKASPYEDISEHFYAAKSEQGIKPSITAYSTDYREAEEVIKKVKEYGPDSCAILARTNLALRCLEEECLNQGVRYHLLGNSGFWEATEIQNVLHYIRCAGGLNDNSLLGALKAPFWPARYIKKKQVQDKIKLRGGAVWSAMGMISEVSDFRNFIAGLYKYQYLPAKDAVQGILKDLKALEYYKDEANINPDKDPVANLRELCRVAERYDSLKDFLNFVRKVSHVTRNRAGVCLSTVHGAKGREWPHVFMISVNAGVLPHVKSDDLVGEKCIMYVGCSRAEETLDISFHGSPSPFLAKFMKEQDE